jgi:hypothetical protein
MKVVRRDPDGLLRGPWCSFPVDCSHTGSYARSVRVQQAARKGIDPNLCGYPVEVEIDDTPYCRRHAAETLLRAHIGPPSGRFGRN